MIEELASSIPRELADVSGRVFYSGRDAFQLGRNVYLLGYNPAGDPNALVADTVQRHTKIVLEDRPSNWSAYRDESWTSRNNWQPPGTATFQPVILQLIHSLGLDPGSVPSSNLVFARSARSAHLNSQTDLEHLCWPFHLKVIASIRPRFIICFGLNTGNIVCRLLGANKQIDRFEEPNNRRWMSDARISVDGRIVFTVTHPSQAKWTTTATDPRPMVVRVFKERV